MINHLDAIRICRPGCDHFNPKINRRIAPVGDGGGVAEAGPHDLDASRAAIYRGRGGDSGRRRNRTGGERQASVIECARRKVLVALAPEAPRRLCHRGDVPDRTAVVPEEPGAPFGVRIASLLSNVCGSCGH